MNYIHSTLAAIGVVLAGVVGGCGDDDDDDGTASVPAAGEHEGEGGEHEGEGDAEHVEEGEESGTQYALDETYDEVRAGARLILAYDAESNSFKGTVENTTEETLEQVRVEVHLSNGTELGSTTPTDLAPGEVIDVELPATDEAFETWSAHPEVGSGDSG